MGSRTLQQNGAVIVTHDIKGSKVIVPVSNELIEKVLSAVRVRGQAEKRWDINTLEGQLVEQSLLKLLSSGDGTVEVKRDFKSAITGNVAIEGAYKGKPSGIMATAAEWWAQVLDGTGYDGEVIVLIKTERLRKLVSQLAPVRGGDNNTASMKLLPVVKLLQKVST